VIFSTRFATEVELPAAWLDIHRLLVNDWRLRTGETESNPPNASSGLLFIRLKSLKTIHFSLAKDLAFSSSSSGF